MATEPMEIDPAVLERARRLAEEAHCSVDEILQKALDEIERRPTARGSIIGLLADDPDLADQILEDVYRTREQSRLRVP
jgi:hypothetical protein